MELTRCCVQNDIEGVIDFLSDKNVRHPEKCKDNYIRYFDACKTGNLSQIRQYESLSKKQLDITFFEGEDIIAVALACDNSEFRCDYFRRSMSEIIDMLDEDAVNDIFEHLTNIGVAYEDQEFYEMVMKEYARISRDFDDKKDLTSIDLFNKTDLNLVIFCAWGDLQKVRELVASGADVHAEDDMPFQNACESDNLDLVKFFLHLKGEQAISLKKNALDALTTAVKIANKKMVTYLVEKYQAENSELNSLITQKRFIANVLGQAVKMEYIDEDDENVETDGEITTYLFELYEDE